MKKRLGIIFFVGVILVCMAGGISHQLKDGKRSAPANAILILKPYRHAGTWVFDDARMGLTKEPFVAGIPKMIDKMVADIPTANKGFRLLFSASPFPNYEVKLVWTRASNNGDWYYCKKYDMEGWLCPALGKYYDKAPKELYIKAESL